MLIVNSGTTVFSEITFRDKTGVLCDPATITHKYGPLGAAIAVWVYGVGVNITKTSTGIYVAAIPTSGVLSPVQWYSAWWAVGEEAAQYDEFGVQPMPL